MLLEPGITNLVVTPKSGLFCAALLRWSQSAGDVVDLAEEVRGLDTGVLELLSIQIGTYELLALGETRVQREGHKAVKLTENGLDVTLVSSLQFSGTVLQTGICPLVIRVRVHGAAAQYFTSTLVGQWMRGDRSM